MSVTYHLQALTGVSEKPWANHSAGAAQILKSRGHTGPQDEFESKLLLSLRGPVVGVFVSLYHGRAADLYLLRS